MLLAQRVARICFDQQPAQLFCVHRNPQLWYALEGRLAIRFELPNNHSRTVAGPKEETC